MDFHRRLGSERTVSASKEGRPKFSDEFLATLKFIWMPISTLQKGSYAHNNLRSP